MDFDVVPGALVRNPVSLDWGLGQIQSVVGDRVTVNFEHMGKMVINISVVNLEVVEEPPNIETQV